MRIINKLCGVFLLGFAAAILVMSASQVQAQTYPDISAGTCCEWITNVTFGSINNTTGSSAGGYGDYSGLSTTVTQSGTFPLSVTISPDTNEYVTAFFDWNQDGDFTDAGESVVVVVNTSSAGPHTVGVTVPAGAVLGKTRMRVVLKFIGPPASFDYIGSGEAEDYTISVYQAAWGGNGLEWITNVTFGDINNPSGFNAGGYGDYTGLSTTVSRGKSLPLSVTISPFGGEYITAFFDWNQDGDFTDPGESVVVMNGLNTTGPHTVNVAVPAGAVSGKTRMRVVVKFGSPPASFGYIGEGEVEDYTIVIKGFPWPMFLSALTTKSDSYWSALSYVFCPSSAATFSLTSSGVTKKSVCQAGVCAGGEGTFEGWVTVAPGLKSFSWIVSASTCGTYPGSFDYPLAAGKNYRFLLQLNAFDQPTVYVATATGKPQSAGLGVKTLDGVESSVELNGTWEITDEIPLDIPKGIFAGDKKSLTVTD